MEQRIPQPDRLAPAQETNGRHVVGMEHHGVLPAGHPRDTSLVILQSTTMS